MKVLVTGSRDWQTPQDVFDALDAAAPDVVIHGGCPTGADAFAEQWCIQSGTPQEVYEAEWERFGKRAGFLRNRRMVEQSPDLVLAFSRNESRGTAMTMKLAHEAGIEVRVHRSN